MFNVVTYLMYIVSLKTKICFEIFVTSLAESHHHIPQILVPFSVISVILRNIHKSYLQNKFFVYSVNLKFILDIKRPFNLKFVFVISVVFTLTAQPFFTFRALSKNRRVCVDLIIMGNRNYINVIYLPLKSTPSTCNRQSLIMGNKRKISLNKDLAYNQNVLF